MWRTSFDPSRRCDQSNHLGSSSVLVVRRNQAICSERGGELTGKQLTSYVVADRLDAGGTSEPLVELVADQGPGELELLLGALAGEPVRPQERAVRQDARPDLVDPRAVQAR